MRTTTLIPQRVPSLADIRSFVESYPAGTWLEVAGVQRGVIDEELGHIYIDYDDHYGDYFGRYLDDEHRAALQSQLGFAPKVAIHVHASVVDPGSSELAQAICKQLRQLWGGTIE